MSIFASPPLNHYVYLFRERGTDTFKIGLTQYIKVRNKEYQFHTLDLVMYAEFAPTKRNQTCFDYARKKAFKLETFLCNHFKSNLIIGREWFRLNRSEVNQIENFMEYLAEVTEDNDYMRVRLVKSVEVIMPLN